jgi:2-oxoglutarate dehydrogenase E2 component (dihydrolipoamide succinyltransferase)
MNVEIKIPDVAESITEVTIGTWLKKNGEHIEADEALCEIETDKASQELFAETSGTLEILVEEGETIDVGSVIGKINENGNASPSSESPKEETKAKEEATPSKESKPKSTGEVKEMLVMELAESITEVTIGTWLKEDGDFVELDEAVCEIETDKASQELPAEASGILRHVAKEGDTLGIGELICKIEVMDEAPSTDSKSADTAPASTENSSNNSASSKESYATGTPSPAAAKILAEKGIPVKDIKGTGVDGRITKEDAEKAQKSAPAKAESKPVEKKETSSNTPEPSGERTQTSKRMSQMRKTIARRLVKVKNETAMLTTFNEANMQPIMDLRSKYKEMFKEKHGVGLGFMSFFAKAAAQALLEFPDVNAMIDEAEGQIVYNDYVDISVAVSTEKGLVVPVLRNVEKLSFAQIEQGIIDLAVKARDGKLAIEDMQGGTFTITNGGVFGSMMSTPIINAPQSAILGMHNIIQRPMAVNGQVVILPMMYLAVSYDHRIIDGKEAVSFLVAIKKYLEEPERLMFGI